MFDTFPKIKTTNECLLKLFELEHGNARYTGGALFLEHSLASSPFGLPIMFLAIYSAC